MLVLGSRFLSSNATRSSAVGIVSAWRNHHQRPSINCQSQSYMRVHGGGKAHRLKPVLPNKNGSRWLPCLGLLPSYKITPKGQDRQEQFGWKPCVEMGVEGEETNSDGSASEASYGVPLLAARGALLRSGGC